MHEVQSEEVGLLVMAARRDLAGGALDDDAAIETEPRTDGSVCDVCRLGMGKGRMRDDWGTSQAAQLRVEASQESAEAVITLEGELDHSTAEGFVACALEVFDTKPSSVTVDAHRLTFTDSSGLSALLRVRGLAFVDQVVFQIKVPSPTLRRLVEVSGTEDWLLPEQ